MDEEIKVKLMEKINKDGGDADFVISLEKIMEEEKDKADASRDGYFHVEKWIIICSALASIAAAAAAIDFQSWGKELSAAITPVFQIIAVVFPAIVSALVAYRGVKKSLETWLRHRKSNLEMNLLINEYLFGSRNFQNLEGEEAYLEFRNRMQDLYQQSKKDFFANMNK